jgi:type I restriction-modification system DNA methylase subunit
MAQNRPEARAEIEKLVRYFADNVHQLKAPTFNEAQVRQQLIDPFFEALGWDVRNRQMLPPYRLEVIPEGRVKTSVAAIHELPPPEYVLDDEFKADQRMAAKKPDYRFRLHGSTKFFVEAKKPSVDLINNVDAIFQIKRYGFSARVPVSILTDFEEFRVFDCTRKPFYDKPKVGALKEFDLTYTAYLDEFDKLYDTFSREAVVGGSIEVLQTKYLQKRTGEFTLDRSFLEDLSEWRVELAQDIAKHPQNRRILNTYTLNECVQRILDRIVFLRVCEDRDIEEVGTLVALLRLWQDHPGLSLYDKFNELIKQRRSLYNGLLFSEHECERLVVSDKILEKIFKNINYPLSPYHFDEIGVEILGSIYGRFLGRTIRLTQRQVRVEEKPEVRKAGGVYYTPQYIVNYIVENTLGRLLYGEPAVLARSPERTRGTTKQSDLPGKNQIASVATLPRNDTRRLLLTPKQVSKLKIIDIACGSGSFLLGAFQKLIDYHIEWYTAHPEDIKGVHGVRDVYEDAQGQLRLSSRKKREILINNIYGVDIDPQAVEVTQMSLYLKVLEDENDATLNKPTMLALHEVLLPPLKNNIKCGNSLIGTDFYVQGELFDENTRRKVNAFDWEREFPEIMKGGGFDVVLGNPPWISAWTSDEPVRAYLTAREALLIGHWDFYLAFVVQALRVLNEGGWHGFILPSSILTEQYATATRRYLIEGRLIASLSTFGIERVFGMVSRKVCILILRLGGKLKRADVNEWEDGSIVRSKLVDPEVWEKNHNFMIDTRSSSEFVSLKRNFDHRAAKVGNYYYVNYGAQISSKVKGSFTKARLLNQERRGNAKRCLIGADIKRYFLKWGNLWLDYQPAIMYGPRHPKFFEGQKIIISKTSSKGFGLMATLDDKSYYCDQRLVCLVKYKEVAGTGLRTDFKGFQKTETSESISYHLGLLNSKAMSFYFRNFVATKNLQGDYTDVLPQMVRALPIRTIDFTNPTEKQMHDELVALVERMLELHKQLKKASFASEKEPIERQIAATDKKIDQHVYQLYGLTDEEIKIVEGM